jgi:membrane fusion protein, heavy metal efflux system
MAAVVCAIAVLKLSFGQPAGTSPPQASAPASNAPSSEATVDLKPSQTNSIKIDAVGDYSFSMEKTAVGSIDYNEDTSVQVFSSYQGKIITAFANLGDNVKKGHALYTIDSPDLIQAESTLLTTAAADILYSNELARATSLYETNGVAKRELEQATSDAQTAEANLKAARNALQVFGKTNPEVDQIIATHKIDSVLVVTSPVNGRVTARNAQPGLLVQPGAAPAPYSVASLATKWMLVYVSENDSPLIHMGQPLKAKVAAFPGRDFDGRISALGTAVDSNTHRLLARCEIADPEDELRPGMLAIFTIQVQEPVVSLAIPVNGVVRNGDGTMAAWVTTDRLHFTQRIIKIGLQRDGQYQVLDGLRRGELAVTDGAVFISNILYAPPTD